MTWARFRAYFTGDSQPSYEGFRSAWQVFLETGDITEAQFDQLNAALVGFETGELRATDVLAVEEAVWPEVFV